MDDEDRLTRLEYALFGLRGDNGLLSEVRELRKEFKAYREKEIDEHKKDFRWRVGTAIAIISAILVASGIVAGSL